MIKRADKINTKENLKDNRSHLKLFGKLRLILKILF